MDPHLRSEHEHGSHMITAKSKAANIQQVISCSKVEWSRFLVLRAASHGQKSIANYFEVITADEADQLISKLDLVDPKPEFLAWREVPAKPQQELIDEVKRRLTGEGISRIDDYSQLDQLEKAVRWRMTQVIKAKRARPSCKLLQFWRFIRCLLTFGKASRQQFDAKPGTTVTGLA
jgi:hypothetical protein